MIEEPFSDEVQEFNLIDEDWIPVIDMKGIEREVSIREALLHAEDLRDITGELPTVRFAILRVLLAIIYRAFDEEIEGEPLQYWGELWREGPLPAELIEPYLDDWHHRFDLLSPTEPFMQVPVCLASVLPPFRIERSLILTVSLPSAVSSVGLHQ